MSIAALMLRMNITMWTVRIRYSTCHCYQLQLVYQYAALHRLQVSHGERQKL